MWFIAARKRQGGPLQGSAKPALGSEHQGNRWLMMLAGGRNYFVSKLLHFFLSSLSELLFPKNE